MKLTERDVTRQVLKLTIPGAPRTKKNHAQIVQALGRPVLVPSPQYKKWFRGAMSHVPVFHSAFNQVGVPIPITNQVSVKATFFRDANIGDAVGYYESLGDFLQAPRYKNGKRTRNGAGIIEDDRQIRDWDGSRLKKDAACPRIEVAITIIGNPVGGQTRMAFEEVKTG